MAEETAEKKAASPFLCVPADKLTEIPAAASARLTWTGSDGETIDYISTAAHVEVRDDNGVLLGRMFSLAFTAVDAEGNADRTRPITFAYNGGPGCASVPIDFGGIGPKRVATDGAYGPALLAKAHRVICKVGGCPAQGFPRREHIPQNLTDSDNHLLHTSAFL